MPNLLRITAIGHLGRNPTKDALPSGNEVVNFSMAVTDKSKNGETTTWLNVATFGKTAEIAMQYLRKGNPVYVEGRFRLREWTDSDGAKRLSPEVIANQIVLLGGRPAESEAPNAPPTRKATPTSGRIEDMDEDPLF